MEKSLRRYEYIRCKTIKRIRKREFKAKETSGGFKPGQCYSQGRKLKKLLSPIKRKVAVDYVVEIHSVTERRACRVLSVNRTAYRYEAIRLPDEDDGRV